MAGASARPLSFTVRQHRGSMIDTPKWVERWQRQRAPGRSRFILQTGGGYGLAMFIALTFFGPSAVPLTARTILINALIFAAAGFLFGVVVWGLSERRYQKYLRSAGRDAA